MSPPTHQRLSHAVANNNRSLQSSATALPPLIPRLNLPPRTIPSGLQVSYSPRPALFRQEHEFLNSNNPVRRLQTLEKVRSRDADVLNFRVVTNTSAKVLGACERNRLRRRWNAAVAGAFREESQRDADGNGNKRSLVGTLELMVHHGYGMELEWADLLRDAKSIVGGLVNINAGGNGRGSQKVWSGRRTGVFG